MLNFKRLKLDYYLLFLISLIAITSLFAIYSSDSINMNVSGMALRQGVWFLISICVLVMINLTGNNFFIKYAHYFYLIGNILLLYLLFFGPVINNARCWFRIPGIGTIQVSEFMKICLILMGSKFIATTRFKNKFKDEMLFIIKLGLIFLIPSILTFLEPDTGAVLMYIVIYITLLYSSKLRLRYFLIIGFILVLMVALPVSLYLFDLNNFIKIFGSSFFLRVGRITSWFNAEGMQLQNSIASISSAGFKGHGFMANPIYYPEAHTDFVFVSIATSLGFIGSFIFVGLLLALDLRILEIGVNNKKPINRYITNSVCCILLFQQIQNIGMTIGLLPIMGITLPFVSYGGSSLISYMFMIGLVLNIYKESSSRMNL